MDWINLELVSFERFYNSVYCYFGVQIRTDGLLNLGNEEILCIFRPSFYYFS